MADAGTHIRRMPMSASGRVYDMIVVGGGIYGAFLAFEGSRAGLRTLLLERDDFGGRASGSSLRIAHGGLRYLQSLDFRRFRRSVREREWLRTHFPHLVQEMGCLMPLHGDGLKKPWVMRAALRANDMAVGASAGGAGSVPWPPSRVLNPRMTREVYPSVPEERLAGSAFWYDGLIRSSPRLLMEVIRWSCGLGATALNYVEALEVQVRGGRVKGVLARDRASGRDLVFHAPVVVNAAGASIPRLAASAGAEAADLFHPTLGFNLLLRKTPLSDQALAVSPPGEPGARSFFMIPWNGKILAGTWHGPANVEEASDEGPAPGSAAIDDFLEGLNLSAPALDAGRGDIVRTFAGLLPGDSEGATRPRDRPRIVRHADRGEAVGLISVSGVKYTTARVVAAGTVGLVVPPRRGARGRRYPGPSGARGPEVDAAVRQILLEAPSALLAREPEEVMPVLHELVRNEAVLHLDDILLRRTDWGADPAEGREVARFLEPLLQDLPEWKEHRQSRESTHADRNWSDSTQDAFEPQGTGPAA